MRRFKYVRADATQSAWKLPHNDLWNVPADTNEVRGHLITSGPWRIPVSYRALCVGLHGYVYGIRTMRNVRQSSYVLEGRVKLFGRSYRAFTSSVLFERPDDGSLVNVAVIHVCDRGARHPRAVKCVEHVSDITAYWRECPGYAVMAMHFNCRYRDENAFSAEIDCGVPLG